MDARDWDRRYTESELVWSAGPNRFVAEELEELRPGRALDVAAGEGRNALWLAEQGWDVTAVDFSLAGLDKARRLQTAHPRGRDLRIVWVHDDVLAYDAGGGVFDLVVIAYLQLVAEQRAVAVRRSFEMLAPGGTLLLVAHDSTNLTDGTGGPQDPDVLYTAEEVLGDLDGERFEVRRAERVARAVPVPDEAGRPAQQTAYDCLVRVERTG